MLDIKEDILVLERKQKKNEMIYFDMNIPSSDFKREIKLKNGIVSDPYYPVTNYFLTYGILHEFIQLSNNIKKETFEHFCGKILDRYELGMDDFIYRLVKEEKYEKKHIQAFDFSGKGFFTDKTFKVKRGSDLRNVSWCYNNSIETKVLDLFTSNVTEESVFVIKMSNITSIASIDIIRLLNYIFKNMRLIKLVQDSFFKDSFHIIISSPNIKRYEEVKREIKQGLSTVNKDKSLVFVTKPSLYTDNEVFETYIKEFATQLEGLIASYLFHIISLIRSGIKDNHRNKDQWKYLDYYTSVVNN